MQKRHFEYAARLVLQIDDSHRAYEVAQAYATLFKAFNPLFDLGRFYKACGLPV